MANNFDHFEQLSKEKLVVPRIILNFFRHSIKEPRGNKENKDVQLTQEGRELAKSKFHAKDTFALAFADKDDRTKETALLTAFGGDMETDSLIETSRQINQGLKYGSRLGQDDRLAFKNSHETGYYLKLRESFDRKEPLKFLVEESDYVAELLNDEGGATYSRMASQIAQVIEKYLKAVDNWESILESKPEEYDSSTLERFMGTHRGLCESFIAKVIEKTLGKAERDKFVKALDYQCFSETEGFSVDIGKYNEEKIVFISFEKRSKMNGEVIYSFEKTVPLNILQEIIEEGKRVKEVYNN